MTATYARYSSDQQRDTSLADQERNCIQAAVRLGLPPVSLHYRDQAMSGSRNDRPDYLRLMADAGAEKFTTLIVDDLSRLSRDDVEMKKALRRLQFLGIRIIGASDGYDSHHKGHKVQAFARGFVNELYLDDLAEKTHRGLTGQALKGFSAGGRTYGYRSVADEDPTRTDSHGRPAVIGVRREIDPEQAPVVVQIFEWYAAGKSLGWIVNELNHRNIPTMNGGKWARTGLYPDRNRPGVGLLGNPLYIGQYIWNRSQWIKDPDTGRRIRRERPQSEWQRLDLPELRIIDQPLWDKVQARIQASRQEAISQAKAGKRSNGSRPARYLLSGILRCGCCGGRYVTINSQRYGCATRKESGLAACSNTMTVKRDVAERALLAGLKNDLLNKDAMALFRKEVSRLLRQAKKTTGPDTRKAELAEVEKQITHMVTAIGQGAYSQALQQALTDAEQRRDQLQAQITASARTHASLPDILPNLDKMYKGMVERLEETLASDTASARELLKEIIGDTVIVSPSLDGQHLQAEIQIPLPNTLPLVAGADLAVDNGGSGGWI